ncbi:hypothetical protein KIN20_006560 [Parelaphostrongylus tenuis]|uniref:Uncharacterized protein n=1 Tax=Parelaphostrongylus tenuis TaxID=148309 RepID=A0AAD5QGV4_PARTN|nr:hypothetical protein KIN20_006560 [Parelaphostrongylus tenuis]
MEKLSNPLQQFNIDHVGKGRSGIVSLQSLLKVLDVLEQQGRAAGLPDFVITTILGQLGINVLYAPLPCPVVSVDPNAPIDRAQMATMTTCVILATQ